MSRPSARTLSWIVVITIFVVDFLTKRWVLANQVRLLEGVDLIEGVFRFTYVRNAGAAFGMLQGARWILTAVSIVAVAGLSWVISKPSTRGLKRVASTMILAGAAGNLVDRLAYGGLVVDFMEFRFIDFPVFNVADMGVSLGAVVLVLSLLIERDHEEHENGDPEAPSPEPGAVTRREHDGAAD